MLSLQLIEKPSREFRASWGKATTPPLLSEIIKPDNSWGGGATYRLREQSIVEQSDKHKFGQTWLLNFGTISFVFFYPGGNRINR